MAKERTEIGRRSEQPQLRDQTLGRISAIVNKLAEVPRNVPQIILAPDSSGVRVLTRGDQFHRLLITQAAEGKTLTDLEVLKDPGLDQPIRKDSEITDFTYIEIAIMDGEPSVEIVIAGDPARSPIKNPVVNSPARINGSTPKGLRFFFHLPDPKEGSIKVSFERCPELPAFFSYLMKAENTRTAPLEGNWRELLFQSLDLFEKTIDQRRYYQEFQVQPGNWTDNFDQAVKDYCAVQGRVGRAKSRKHRREARERLGLVLREERINLEDIIDGGKQILEEIKEIFPEIEEEIERRRVENKEI